MPFGLGPASVSATTSWFELRLVAGPKDAGLGGISLSVRTPDGATRSATANAGGVLRLDGVKRGACKVLSDLRDARIENSAALCGASDSERAQKSGQSTDLSGVEHVVEVTEHRVRTGETLKGIADQVGIKWQDLAFFNWGTRDPEEINRHLAEDLGVHSEDRGRQELRVSR